MAIFQQTRPMTAGSSSSPETAIGAFVRINGTLSSDGDVQFDGILENGEMKIKGCLTIGPSAKVTASVKAQRIVLHGVVEGNVTTDEDVEIGASGKLQGDLNAGGNLVIHPGGVFIGKSMMVGRQDADTNGATPDKGAEEAAK